MIYVLTTSTVLAILVTVVAIGMRLYIGKKPTTSSTESTHDDHKDDGKKKDDDHNKDSSDHDSKKSHSHDDHGHHEKGWLEAFFEVAVFKWIIIGTTVWLLLPWGCDRWDTFRQKQKGTYVPPTPDYIQFNTELRMEGVTGMFWLKPIRFGPDIYEFRSPLGDMDLDFNYKTGDGKWLTHRGESGKLKVTHFNEGLGWFTFTGEWERDLPTKTLPQKFVIRGEKR